MITEKSITELGEGDICQYFPLRPESLPEAFPEHNKSPATAMLPKPGCKGLQVSYLTLSPMPIPLQKLLPRAPSPLETAKAQYGSASIGCTPDGKLLSSRRSVSAGGVCGHRAAVHHVQAFPACAAAGL